MMAGDGVEEILVRAAGGDYPVLVGAGVRRYLPELLVRYAPAHRYAFISDSNVAPLYAGDAVEECRRRGLTTDLFVFPAGEASKTRAEWARLTDLLLASGLGRDGAVVAVGGGVTGDLAGFTAATFLRGIPVVQVPTSLVAMVDAAVGGKTGVDVAAGKNLVGVFHPPRLVVADVETVATLPTRERTEGWAEALKHGAIADAAYLQRLADAAAGLIRGDPSDTRDAVTRSIRIKAEVVSGDEREAGRRQILNFGHTFGHALEAALGYGASHGLCVAAGMMLEARVGEKLGVSEVGTVRRIEAVLGSFGLGRVPAPSGGVDSVLSFLSADKKARKGRIRCVLLRRPGEVAKGEEWSHPVTEAVARGVLQAHTPWRVASAYDDVTSCGEES